MSRRNPPAILALLAALTLATLAARAWRVDNGLPQRSEPDAVLVWQAGGLELERAFLPNRHDAHVAMFYPLLLSRLLVALPGHSAAQPAPPDAPLEEHLAAATRPYLRGRLLILALSVLLVPGTFFVARRFLEPPWALLAAAFVATSLLHTSLSQMARPHGALATMCLLAVLAALRLLERPTRLAVLINALVAALAASCLHSGLFVVPTAMAAAWFAPAERVAERGKRLALLLAVVLAVGLWSYTSIYEQLGFIDGGEDEARVIVAGQNLPLSRYGPAGYLRIVPRLWGVDPALVLFAGLGLLALVPFVRRGRELRRPLWIFALHPFFTLFFFGLHPIVPSRFLLPVVPFLALLAALGLRALLRNRVAPALAAALSVLVLAYPAAAAGYHLHHRGTQDSHERLAQWLQSRPATAGSYVLAPYGITVPLWMEPARWEPATRMVWSPWIAYLVQALPSVEGRTVFDVEPWLPTREVPDFAALLPRLGEAPPGVLVVRRPSGDEANQAIDRTFPRADIEGALGAPVFVLDPSREEGDLARALQRFAPRDLRSILANRYPGAGYEVYALPSLP